MVIPTLVYGTKESPEEKTSDVCDGASKKCM